MTFQPPVDFMKLQFLFTYNILSHFLYFVKDYLITCYSLQFQACLLDFSVSLLVIKINLQIITQNEKEYSMC